MWEGVGLLIPKVRKVFAESVSEFFFKSVNIWQSYKHYQCYNNYIFMLVVHADPFCPPPLDVIEWSGNRSGTENRVSGSGAVNGCDKIRWSGSGAWSEGQGAMSGAVSGGYRNRYER